MRAPRATDSVHCLARFGDVPMFVQGTRTLQRVCEICAYYFRVCLHGCWPDTDLCGNPWPKGKHPQSPFRPATVPARWGSASRSPHGSVCRFRRICQRVRAPALHV
eukprot:7355954-Pyramimonas_sp.AAC.1